jgi:hypothetical protein
MIFNPNDCAVAPPHTRGDSAVRAKGVCANLKVSWCFKKWHRDAIKSIVVQQKMASR